MSRRDVVVSVLLPVVLECGALLQSPSATAELAAAPAAGLRCFVVAACVLAHFAVWLHLGLLLHIDCMLLCMRFCLW
jgi:hypothetical protein